MLYAFMLFAAGAAVSLEVLFASRKGVSSKPTSVRVTTAYPFSVDGEGVRSVWWQVG